MVWLTFIGILFNLLGVISLAIGFRIGKTQAEEKGTEFYLEDKLPIVLYYESPWVRRIGWFCLIFGYLIQILSLFVD